MAVYWDNRKGKKYAPGIRGWWFRFIEAGARHEGRGYLSKGDALEAENQARREVRGLVPKTTPITFRKVATEYFRQCESANTAKHFQQQEYRYKAWFPAISKLKVSDLTPALINDQLRRWAKAQSNITANRNLDFLKTIIRTGLDLGLLSYTDDLHKILRVKRLPVTKNEKYIPPREDILKVYLKCNKRDRCLLDVYLGTLARKRELFDLEWGAVDLAKKNLILTTRKTKGGDTKKTLVPMTTEVHKALTWVDRNRLSERWVFPSTKTKEPYFDRNKWFEHLCVSAGVRHFNFHNLRHYSSNLAADRGAEARQSQELLRHDNMTTTNTYLQGLRGVRPETMKLVKDPLGMRSKKKSYANRTQAPKRKGAR